MEIKTYLILTIGFICFITSCDSIDRERQENPAAVGFNLAESDTAAIALADEAMKAMGGRKAWDKTHYIAWNFFGMRHLIWNKKTGDVRIDYTNEDLSIIVNIHSLKGKVRKAGAEVHNTDSLRHYLEMGKNTWINDSYWLVMPFKLKDSGVTLHYLGEDTTQAGDSAYVIMSTFNEVGQTPQNKYKIFIDKQSHLVSQWAYFEKASQDTPNFILPWQNYKRYGKILLSGDRGERQLTAIKVMDKVPAHTFTDFNPVFLDN